MGVFVLLQKVVLVFLVLISSLVSLSAQVSDFGNYDFSKADSIASLYKGHSLSNLRVLSTKLTGTIPSDIGKFRAIYRWVCDNIENDYSAYLRNKRMRNKLKNQPARLEAWNKKFLPKMYDRLLKDYKTVCTGYAYLVKELAYFASIECRIVDGYGRTVGTGLSREGTPNHSWNAVKIDGKWYVCDPTWSSGSINRHLSHFVKKFNEAYFLAAPSLFAQSHFPLDTKWLLMDQKPKLKAFLQIH